MTTRTHNARTIDETARVPAVARAGDPSLLTQTELDAVAGGGGPAGANPSRGNPRA